MKIILQGSGRSGLWERCLNDEGEARGPLIGNAHAESVDNRTINEVEELRFTTENADDTEDSFQ